MTTDPHLQSSDDFLPLLPDLPDLVQTWRTRFVNRSRPYALQQGDGSYRWVYEEVTDDVVAAHLRGELTLALSSTDARGSCHWACLDVDVPGALPELLAVRDELAEIGFAGLVVGSRRGGHLWLCFDEVLPATAVRYAIAEGLAEVAAAGLEVPAHELYPDTGIAGALGHAVRLPLGVHRKTGQRYPPYDEEGLPCLFSSVERAASFVLAATAPISARQVQARWAAFLAEDTARRRAKKHRASLAAAAAATDPRMGPQTGARANTALATLHPNHPVQHRMNHVGTRSAVIRWVDAHVLPLDLLDEFAPEVEPLQVGQGYLGWCPFHDDRASDADGRPGTPSFYVVHNARYGWSWRCLSTNCSQHEGPMRHSFRLWQELLELPASAAVAEAAERWPQAESHADPEADPESGFSQMHGNGEDGGQNDVE